MQIIPGLHQIAGGAANVYLIVEPQGLTLIDTGLPRFHRKIFKYMANLGFQPGQVRNVIITHADGDHYGSLGAIKAASGGRVYASPLEADAISEGTLSRPLKLSGLGKLLFDLSFSLFRPKAVNPDQLLEGGQSLPIFGGMQVIATPGHTPGHISLFAPAPSVLFCGDSLRATSQGRLTPSRGRNTWDQAQALDSLRAQAALNPQIVCPGHGPVIHAASDKFPLV
jgi:glyoxylase-like metal-dependent hydrolase (beta-lactamase superfamily II)